MINAPEISSTRPYLIRALHEWCGDNGFTPYVAVSVDEGVQVPREFVKNGEIVLNVSLDATSNLRLGNDFIEFKARFGGVPRDILVPVGRVLAIYARENGHGVSWTPALQHGRARADPGSLVGFAEPRVAHRTAPPQPRRRQVHAEAGQVTARIHSLKNCRISSGVEHPPCKR